MGKAGRIILVSMGVFWGIVFFGINVTLFHFNRLVEHRHPVYLLDWRVEKNNLEVCLLGERFFFSLDNEIQLPASVGERTLNIVNHARGEAEENLAEIKKKLEEREWMVPDIIKFLRDRNLQL